MRMLSWMMMRRERAERRARARGRRARRVSGVTGGVRERGSEGGREGAYLDAWVFVSHAAVAIVVTGCAGTWVTLI